MNKGRLEAFSDGVFAMMAIAVPGYRLYSKVTLDR